MIKPGGDPPVIRLKYEGVEGLVLDKDRGDLAIYTVCGMVLDEAPQAFQSTTCEQIDIQSSYRLQEDRTVTFEVGEYDPSVPLVIDPGLQFSTYVGGSGEEKGYAIDLDGEGNIYITGETSSSDFPTTTGAYAEDHFGDFDLFVSKIDPTGSTLIFSTYVGGSSYDYGKALRIASDNGVYVTGETNSDDFPTTDDAYDRSYNGGRDTILLKLSSAGSELLYSSYFGGSQMDVGFSLAIDDYGSVFICGLTQSDDLPTTANAFCSTYNGPRWNDAFVMEMNRSLSHMNYCTYIGGSGGDGISDFLVDSLGNAYAVGSTNSTDFPVTAGAYCVTIHSDTSDVFVLKLDLEVSNLSFSTFLGGSGDDYGREIEIADNGSVYVIGSTQSSDFPLTPNAIRTTRSYSEAFLTVLDRTGSSLEFCTFLGGSESDWGRSLAWDGPRNTIYVSGHTASHDLPVTRGSFDSFNRGENDVFIMGINIANLSISYCTYVGGEMDDENGFHGLVSDGTGNLSLVGWTWSAEFPTMKRAYSDTNKGYWDVFIIRIEPEQCDPPPAPTGLVAESNVGYVDLHWTAPGIGNCRVLKHYVYRGDAPGNVTFLAEVQSFDRHVDNEVFGGMRYYYRISAVSSAGEGPLSGSVWAIPTGPPSAPRNLRASTGDGTVRLNWTAPDALGDVGRPAYRIFRGETRDALEFLETVENATSYVDADVVIGTFYYYAVLAFNSYGDSPKSEAVRIKPFGRPSAPLDFSLTPGDGRVSLSWKMPASDGGSMILGFQVHRGTTPDNTELIATVMDLTFVDTNVTNGFAYIYYVGAFSEIGIGETTSVLDAIPFGLPTKVLDLQAQAGDGHVLLTWTAPSSDGGRAIIRYNIYVGQRSGLLAFLVKVGDTLYNHTGLTNGVTYYYYATAVNEAGEGPQSSEASAKPMGLPGVPERFTASHVPEGIRLSWQNPTDFGGATIVSFNLLKGMAEDALSLLVVLTEETEYVDIDVIAGRTYRYAVRAVNEQGEGPLSKVLSVAMLRMPGPVSDLVANVGDNRVALNWSPPADDGGSPVTRYIILRGLFETALSEIAHVTGFLNYTDTDVENGKTYYYAVRAANAAGRGTSSDTVSATPLGLPGAPPRLEARVEGNAIVLSWSAPTLTGTASVTGYVIYRGTSEDDLQLLAEAGNVLSYTDTDVGKGKTYYYTVAAKSDVGPGAVAQPVKVEIKKEEDGPGLDATMLLLALFVMFVIKMRRTKSFVGISTLTRLESERENVLNRGGGE